MRTSAQIRQDFFDFFKSHTHTIVPSASLVPDNDPTLLFTNAGMNQFKDVFLSTGSRSYTRAADTQKVMRVSGKHNDFDDVGRDGTHHTFFEMLGNWSFGDYYKKEAITWAWDLLTNVWGLPKERLYATVHHTDKESMDLWKSCTDIDPTHILEFGDKENFWEMGATGPCGPCSEIHIDRTPDLARSKGASGVNKDPEFLELWNLVFIQYNRQEDGSLVDLPAKHVDTGMGLERIVSVLQETESNYQTDLFSPIINHLVSESKVAYADGVEGTPHRVIADHIRALTFAIGDGIIPSNEGRGYVVRKILRRAVRFGRELNYTTPFLYRIVDVVVKEMGSVFPEIAERKASIAGVIQAEEQSFFRTLNKGFDKIKELITNAKANKTSVSGEDVFLLYDSMGFPVDFTEQILKDEDLSFDKTTFDKLMEAQKERARASWKGDAIDFSAFGNLPATTYTGENSSSAEGRILGIVSDNKNIKTAQEGQNIAVILDKTPFYAQKGGQIGDAGTLSADGTLIDIVDTKLYEGRHVHLGVVVKGVVSVEQAVLAEVDSTRKKRIARHHSAAHLLAHALRTVLGDHIGQAGSWVGEDRVRFDFTHPKALSHAEWQKVEELVNAHILANNHTDISEMPIEEAKKTGAVAAFEEKYGDIVRIVTMGASKEFCGGTHVGATGEIGSFVLLHESSVSAGTRRIEAAAGESALYHYKEVADKGKQLAETLKTGDGDPLAKAEALIADITRKDKEIRSLKDKLAAYSFQKLESAIQKVGSYSMLVAKVDGDTDTLNIFGALFTQKYEGVMVLGVAKDDGGALLSASVSPSLTKKIQAGNIVKTLAPLIGGGGGGKPTQAVAGGKDASNLDKALAQAQNDIQRELQ
ncbi:MAG: alanine--tRNA ligase [Brevinema sp.]